MKVGFCGEQVRYRITKKPAFHSLSLSLAAKRLETGAARLRCISSVRIWVNTLTPCCKALGDQSARLRFVSSVCSWANSFHPHCRKALGDQSARLRFVSSVCSWANSFHPHCRSWTKLLRCAKCELYIFTLRCDRIGY